MKGVVMFFKSGILVILVNVCWLAIAKVGSEPSWRGIALGPTGAMLLYLVLPPLLGWWAGARVRGWIGASLGVGAAYGVLLVSLMWIDQSWTSLGHVERWVSVSAVLAASSVGLTVAGYLGFQIRGTLRGVGKSKGR